MYIGPMDDEELTPERCLGVRTRRASRAVTRVFDARLRPLDVKITQFIILGALAPSHDGSQGHGGSIATLAEKLNMEPSTLVRNVQLLKRRGLVIGDGAQGRRGQRLALTHTGLALVARARPVWHQAHADLVAELQTSVDAVRIAVMRLEQAALSMERNL